MKNPTNLTSVSSETFEADVLNSDIPVIVDIWAEWCPPCRMLTPLLEKFAAELSGVVKIVKLNRDENEELAVNTLGAKSIPRLQVFQGGKQVDEQIGLPDYENLKKWFIATLAKVDIEYDGDSEGELPFADAVIAAFASMDEAVADEKKALDEALKPFSEKMNAFSKELEGQGIDGDELQEKLQARQQELMPEIQPALDALQAVSQPAEAQFIEDIEAATAAFLNGTAQADDSDADDSNAVSAGKVCEIGDPNCQS